MGIDQINLSMIVPYIASQHMPAQCPGKYSGILVCGKLDVHCKAWQVEFLTGMTRFPEQELSICVLSFRFVQGEKIPRQKLAVPVSEAPPEILCLS